MSDAPILVGAGEPPGPDLRPSPDIAWRLLGTTGAAFAVVSLTDLALVWVRPHFGDGAWVLDTVGSVFAGMPLLALGLALMLVSAVVLNRPLLLRLPGWVLIVLATAVLAAARAGAPCNRSSARACSLRLAENSGLPWS